MPWEGYNFEDAILISERLVYDDLYTSIHIEKYEIEIKQTELGLEQITREIPEIPEIEIKHLDKIGIAKLGSWIEEGDILVGKITPIKKKEESPYKKLLYTILERQFIPFRDSSLRAPKGSKAKVIDIRFFKNENFKLASAKNKTTFVKENRKKIKDFSNSKKLKLENSTSKNNKKKNLIVLNKKNSLLEKKGATKSSILLKIKKLKYLKNSVIHQIDKADLMIEFKNSLIINKKKQTRVNLVKIYSKKKFLYFFIKTFKKSNTIKLNRFLGGQIIKKFPLLNKENNLFKSSFHLKFLPIKNKINKTKNIKNLDFLNKNKILKQNLENRLIRKIKIKRNHNINFINQISSIKIKSVRNILRKIYKKFIYKKKKNLISTALKNYKSQRIFFFKNKIKNQQIPKYLGEEEVAISSIHIYLADKRKIQVGDKMSGRHGNKGIVSQILPREDMPYLPDGTPLDMVLNPLGVPSRMNVGQIYECLLGFAGKYLGERFQILPFDEIYGPEASRNFVYSKLHEARIKTGMNWLYDPNNPGKIKLYDGRTGESFDQTITVGQSYILRLVHMVDDKIHCLTPDHEVLTTSGWVPINEITTDHKVATLVVGTGELYLDCVMHDLRLM
jgi:DNA-directed RNA polymerase beta subunit